MLKLQLNNELSTNRFTIMNFQINFIDFSNYFDDLINKIVIVLKIVTNLFYVKGTKRRVKKEGATKCFQINYLP